MPSHGISNCRPDNNAVAQCDAFPKRSAEVRSKRLGADASQRYLFGALIYRSKYDLKRFIFAACEVNTWLLCSWGVCSQVAAQLQLQILGPPPAASFGQILHGSTLDVPLTSYTPACTNCTPSCFCYHELATAEEPLKVHDVRGGLLHILRASV